MRKKTLFLLAGLAILSTTIFIFSCRKQADTANDVPADSALNVSFARKYFYNTLRKTNINNLQIASAEQKADAKLYPFWKEAYSSKTDKYTFVEVPIVSHKSPFILYSFAGKNEAKRTSDKSILDVSCKRLVMYKNKSGVIKERIITYIPDRDYAIRHQNDITHNQINKLDNDFSGYLEYSDWNQKRLFVLRISNGHAVRRADLRAEVVRSISDVSVNSAEKPKLKVNETCEYFSDPIYFVTCGTSVDSSSPTGFYTTCSEEIVGYNDYEICTPDFCDDPANFNTAECGGDDGGDDGGNDPGCSSNCDPPNDDDPCGQTKYTAAGNFNSMMHGNSSIAGAITTTTNYGNNGSNSKEASYTIEKSSSGVITATTPVVGSGSGSTVSPTSNTIAFGHGHTVDGFPQPSGVDFYAAGETRLNYPKVNTEIVTSPSTGYAIVVTDSAAFVAFETAHPFSTTIDTASADFKVTTPMGLELLTVGANAYDNYLSLHAVNAATPTPAEAKAAEIYANEASMVYFVAYFNPGMVLLKKDPTTGDYKPLHVTATVVNGKTVYTPSPCN